MAITINKDWITIILKVYSRKRIFGKIEILKFLKDKFLTSNEKSKKEIFVTIKKIGFTFHIEKKIPHNLINPALLSFFNEVNSDILNTDMSGEPFYFDNKLLFNDAFHPDRREFVKCKDGKLRECRSFKVDFEFDGHIFSEIFYLDKSLQSTKTTAILGADSFNKLIYAVNGLD